MSAALEPPLEPVEDLLALPVTDLDISVRLETCLRNEGCCTLADVVTRTERQLLRCPNFGKVTLAELKRLLERVGLALAESNARDGTPPLPFPSVHARLTRIEQRLTALECQSGKPTTDDP